MTTRWARYVVGIVTLVAARGAQAAAAQFGERGQLVIDQGFSASVWHRRQSSDTALGSYSTTSVGVSPSVSYFVLPHASLGLRATLGRSWASFNNGQTQTILSQWGAAPSVGYAISLGDHFDLWPALSCQYLRYWATIPGIVGGDGGSSSLAGSISVPLLWVPAEHFFVGFGPSLSVASSGPGLDQLQDPSLLFGATSQIGGYFEP